MVAVALQRVFGRGAERAHHESAVCEGRLVTLRADRQWPPRCGYGEPLPLHRLVAERILIVIAYNLQNVGAWFFVLADNDRRAVITVLLFSWNFIPDSVANILIA